MRIKPETAKRYLDDFALFAQKRGVELDKTDRGIMSISVTIARYAASQRVKWPKPRNGFTIFGNYGAGKTELARTIVFYFRETFGAKFVFASATRIINDFYLDDGRDYYRKEFQRSDVFLDDLGAEEDARKFGRRWGIGDFIRDRYEFYTKYGSATWITTNLKNFSEISRKYGEDITSRIKEMNATVVIKHSDRRLALYDNAKQETERILEAMERI